MPDDARTVPVTLEFDVETATVLKDPAMRARVELLVTRMVRPASIERLFEVIDALSAEAHRRGLTDEILEAELVAYNAERRNAPTNAGHGLNMPQTESEDGRKSADELVERFKAFAAMHTLDGLNLKNLISEGRR